MGHLELLAIADGVLYHDWLDQSGTWQGWTEHFIEPLPLAQFVTTAMGAGYLQLFVIANGNLYLAWQDPAGTWGGWAEASSAGNGTGFFNGPTDMQAVAAALAPGSS